MVLATRETATQRHWTCGRRLRERRHALGLTQAELVGRLGGDPAITNRSISTWENGRGLDFGWLPELAVALDCSVTYLLGMTDDPQRWEPAPDAAAGSMTAEAATTVAGVARASEPDDLAAAPRATTPSSGVPEGSSDPMPADVACNWILGPGPIPPDRPADRPPPDRPSPDRPAPDRPVPDRLPGRGAPPASAERKPS
jgi:transcriptional regulator with XRE-family HTH domain